MDASRLFITQIGLEPLLRRSAQERGAEHAYATELVSFEQDDDGVTAVCQRRLKPDPLATLGFEGGFQRSSQR